MKKKILSFLVIIIFINTFTVYAQSDSTPPNINNIIISNEGEISTGDILKIIIEVSDTESGFDENTYCSIDLYNGSRYINFLHPKYNIDTGNFELNYEIPSDMQSGNWYICSVSLYDKAGNFKSINNSNPEKYNFNLKSSFNGTENEVIKKGEEFSLLEGVTFSNKTEGNLTNKLKYYGEVNINKEGIYLVKYEVDGNNEDIYILIIDG